MKRLGAYPLGQKADEFIDLLKAEKLREFNFKVNIVGNISVRGEDGKYHPIGKITPYDRNSINYSYLIMNHNNLNSQMLMKAKSELERQARNFSVG